MLAGADNATSATIETLESSRERASVIGYSLIILPVGEVERRRRGPQGHYRR